MLPRCKRKWLHLHSLCSTASSVATQRLLEIVKVEAVAPLYDNHLFGLESKCGFSSLRGGKQPTSDKTNACGALSNLTGMYWRATVHVFRRGWPAFSADVLHSGHSSNPLYFWSAHAVFSHGRMNGLTDLWQWNMQVALVLNQTAMNSACRANTLERCAVMRSEVVSPQVTTSFLSLLFVFGLVLIRGSFGRWWTCLLHSSHSAWYGKRIPMCYFCLFQTAWRPTAIAEASAMLFLRRNKACDIHILAGNQCFLITSSFICQPFPAQDYVVGCGHGMTALRHNSWDFIRPVWWLQVVNINVVCLLYHSFIETQIHICKHSGSCSRCIAAKSYAIKTIM